MVAYALPLAGAKQYKKREKRKTEAMQKKKDRKVQARLKKKKSKAVSGEKGH